MLIAQTIFSLDWGQSNLQMQLITQHKPRLPLVLVAIIILAFCKSAFIVNAVIASLLLQYIYLSLCSNIAALSVFDSETVSVAALNKIFTILEGLRFDIQQLTKGNELLATVVQQLVAGHPEAVVCSSDFDFQLPVDSNDSLMDLENQLQNKQQK